ncbi:MAG TPA: RNA polymerase sigma factor, partial [Candidatus Polarisedimenticolia bacterium]|nr:RNA polymerase sigma factor [Candidatus Polarisedimenticolia bacterium]
AEEAAQDAFLRAWRALPRFRGECAFSTWLHRIVVRRSLDRQEVLRSRRAREAPLDDADPGSLASPATEPEGSPATLKIERLLGSLSDVQRAVVLLYYYEDRSVEEVSRALDMATGTVKTHLHRARAALRASWQAEEEGTDA